MCFFKWTFFRFGWREKTAKPWCQSFWTFFFVSDIDENKLGCFVASETFQPILTIGTNTSFFQEHWRQKRFYIVAQSGQVRKPFSSALILFKNKPGCFVASETFQPILITATNTSFFQQHCRQKQFYIVA